VDNGLKTVDNFAFCGDKPGKSSTKAIDSCGKRRAYLWKITRMDVEKHTKTGHFLPNHPHFRARICGKAPFICGYLHEKMWRK
jgi:hypothetical protein